MTALTKKLREGVGPAVEKEVSRSVRFLFYFLSFGSNLVVTKMAETFFILLT
jgi:hypothetical protein